jgi:phosphoenolpyruvate carboxylase
LKTVEDLQNAEGVMNTLYKNPDYRTHLEGRNRKQTIMLGFFRWNKRWGLPDGELEYL